MNLVIWVILNNIFPWERERESRRIIYKSKEQPTTNGSNSLLLNHGDICLMSRKSQDSYTHTIPEGNHRTKSRISITFRYKTGVLQLQPKVVDFERSNNNVNMNYDTGDLRRYIQPVGTSQSGEKSNNTHTPKITINKDFNADDIRRYMIKSTVPNPKPVNDNNIRGSMKQTSKITPSVTPNTTKQGSSSRMAPQTNRETRTTRRHYSQESRRKCLIIHDSLLNKFDKKLFYRRAETELFKAYTFDNLIKSGTMRRIRQIEGVDTIIIQLGVNDLKSRPAKNVIEDLKGVLLNLAQTSSAKIFFSLVLPVGCSRHLNENINMFNILAVDLIDLLRVGTLI